MRLTERDFEILEFLGAQGVVLASQLQERYFQSSGSFRTRMKVLKRAELVEAKSLSELRLVSRDSFLKSHELFPDLNIEPWKVRVYMLGSRFKNRRVGVQDIADVRMWKHQIRLNSVRKVLEDIVPGGLILTDPELREEWRKYKIGEAPYIPDLVIRKDNLNIAVEVERNLKKDSDYYLRFLSYEQGPYSHILYYCETDKIFRRISEIAARFRKIAITCFLDQKKVFQSIGGYQSLESFLGLKNS